MAEKYLVYDSKVDAEKAMSDVWEAYKTDMQSKGFEVINNEIVPINAATGLPDYEAQRTIRWDKPEETLDAKFVVKEPPAELKAVIEVGKFAEVATKPELKPVVKDNP